MLTMFKYFKKRTEQEIHESTMKHDYTGGYKFLPWVWHKRKPFILAILLNLFIAYESFVYYVETKETLAFVMGSILVGGVVGLIVMLLGLEYHDRKRGIMR